MKLQDLQNALGTNKTLTIRDGQVHVGPDSLDGTLPSTALLPFSSDAGIAIEDVTYLPGDNPGMAIVKGKASLPLLGLAAAADVFATFELLGDDTLGVTLQYDLPQGWRFLQSFPDLQLPFDYTHRRYDYESEQSALDAVFAPTEYRFYLTTHTHVHTHDGGDDVSLQEGLNFAGRWKPVAMVGFLMHVLRGQASVLNVHGQVVPLSTPELPLRDFDELYAWDASPRGPGIYLEARIASGLSFPPGSGTIQFTNLRLQTYTPTSRYWSLSDPSYREETAYLGDVVIPTLRTTKIMTVSANVSPGQEDVLEFACQFVDMNVDVLLQTSAAISGGDIESLVPSSLRDAIGTLGPQSASLTVMRSDSKSEYEVACTRLTIGVDKDAKPWSLFDGLIKVRFKSVRIAVVKPFDSKQRAFYATFRGTLEFFEVPLKVKVEAPSLYISAEQIESTTFDLESYFKTYKLSRPSFLPASIRVANLGLRAQPGSYYSFAMELGSSYTIDDKIVGTYSLPNLKLTVSYRKPEKGMAYSNWQFQASTDEGKAVPVIALLEKLAGAVGVGITLPAAVRDAFTVRSTAVTYNSRFNNFAFECWGTFHFNSVEVECSLTVDHRSERPGPPPIPSRNLFGGRILLAPAQGSPPLLFDLRFATEGDSRHWLAAYSDAFGHTLKLRSLFECVLPKDVASLVPPSLGVSLKSAFLASSQNEQPATRGTNDSESALLFGADLGLSVKLSDLPVVGGALPNDVEIGFESLRVILSSAELTTESVRQFNGLLPQSVARLPDGDGAASGTPVLGKGFNVSATLLFGTDRHTLTLPVPEQHAVTVPGATSPLGNTQTAVSAPSTTKWFDIDTSLGPLTVRRIGLDYEAPRVGIKFDAGLQLSVLTFNLEGLGLTYALGESTAPSEIVKNLDFSLDGMGLSLGNGPVEIGGSLMRISRQGEPLQLEGTLLIRTLPFTFAALGSFVDLNGTISVTAFAVLLRELGDPTGTGAFVVTGLAFGFGLNRKLLLPRIEEVESFPLVQAAMGSQDLSSLQALPQRLREYVAPAAGNFWLAAGIKFNSFGMVDSFLLLSVSWGAEVEIGLLGLSRMVVPPLAQPNEAIAGAELALRGVIRIAEGLIQFEARLTENSFIFSRNCRLTGGFAFYVWFAGDFVVSLGGYHPAFECPGHYPRVPRLGMQLQIGQELSITGEAYLALTPACLMAGGRLCAVFRSGGIEAWFIAYADFLMNWQPFYYQAAMGITLGIALKLGALVIRLEVSVDLKLQGPPFGGEARVSLWIISFTIPFGAPVSIPPPLTAAQFVRNCLPAPKDLSAGPDVFSIRITGGLLREQQREGESNPHQIVNAHQLSLSVQSVIPCTAFEGWAAVANSSVMTLASNNPCGIRPMGKTSLHSVFKVVADGIDPDKHVKVSIITGNVPDAVWGKGDEDGLVSLPKKPGRKTIKAALGIRIDSRAQDPVHALPAMPVETLKFEIIKKQVDWGTPEPFSAGDSSPNAGKETIFNTIWSPAVIQKRKEIMACLQRQLPSDLVLNKPNLKQFSKQQDYFQAEPKMCTVGTEL